MPVPSEGCSVPPLSVPWLAAVLPTLAATELEMLPLSWLFAVLWRTEGESGVKGECAKYRDTAHKEAKGYSLYGINADSCKLDADGNPEEEQPEWPSEHAGAAAIAGCCITSSGAHGVGALLCVARLLRCERRRL